MRIILASFLFVAGLFAGTIQVSAASNTQAVLNDIKASFMKKHPGIDVKIDFNSSGKLFQGISQGRPADIYLAANVKYADKMAALKHSSKPIVYAVGKLALYSNGRIAMDKGVDAALKAAKTISIANPITAPYGTASVEFLKNIHMYAAVKSKIVEAGSISKAFVQAKTAADVGFIAYSTIKQEKITKGYIVLDDTKYTPIAQAMTLLSQNNKEAKMFYDYIQASKDAFLKFGYGVKK